MEIFHQRLIFGTHNTILVYDVFDAEKEVADKVVIGDAAARIGVEAMDTPAACRTYNILIAEGRNVVAAVIPA